MYKYKREITSKTSLDNSSFYITNKDTMCSLTCKFGAHRLYDGLYIKNRKVLVENVFEEIEVKGNKYKIANITTSNIDVSSDEYIQSVDMDENCISYDLGEISYTKKIGFDIDEDVLVIKYNVQNNRNNNIKFRACPLVTDRLIDAVRTSPMLKFTQRKSKNGVVINLSVSENRNLYISSDVLVYDKDVEYINNVKHFITDEDLNNNVYTEDLFIPGIFETTIKKNDSKEFNIYISTKEINKDINIEKYFEKRNNIISKIPEEYVELRDLALGISNFDLNNITSYPYIFEFSDLYKKEQTTLDRLLKYINALEEYTRAIDGRYSVLNKIKEAEENLEYIKEIIDSLDKLEVDNEKFLFSFAKLKLWYIEILNKLISENNYLLTLERVDYIKNIITRLMSVENQLYVLKNIETAALMFNAIKICKSMLNKLNFEDITLTEFENSIKDLIENVFFVADKRCIRENLDDEFVKSNIPMIYTLSLSYSCISKDKAMVILDTIFKELYTPYGLRKTFKNDLKSDGMIYPKYLAHFIKANLRQNGVTSASKKIAYNLVKEIIIDISKRVSGGVPHVYNEKGIIIDDIAYDLLTNAEMIRLYDMLT